MSKEIFECPKCSGKKYIEAFSHIKAGLCFLCGGTGFLTEYPKPANNVIIINNDYVTVNNPEKGNSQDIAWGNLHIEYDKADHTLSLFYIVDSELKLHSINIYATPEYRPLWVKAESKKTI